jgi:hypothetical protein
MNMKNLKTSNLTLEQLRIQTKSKGWAASMIGNVVYKFLISLGILPYDYHGIPYFEIGYNWGGIEMGWFFITNKNPSVYLRNHEVGHIIQNAEIGGLRMVWWSFCSFVRYWCRKIFKIKTPYYSWWFEGNATALGDEFVERRKGEKQYE